jgi:integrase
MLDLAYGFKLLAERNRDGSIATQENRKAMLRLFAGQWHTLGYREFTRPEQLGGRHVEALVRYWQREGVSVATIKNRLSVLRWLAQKVGKCSAIAKDNAAYGLENRRYVTDEQKARPLDREKWASIKDEYIRCSLELEAAFGLRREESMKFQPHYADQGDHLRLKASWTKGGKERTVPIRTEAQRELLNRLHKKVGKASLIPANRTYVQQMKIYERSTKAAGLGKCHALRHQYAQDRYLELSGMLAPKAGGKSSKELTPEEKARDYQARLTISSELGHGREQITAQYLGR